MTVPTRDDRQHAEDTLSYIRQTMESATTFTAVSGWGVVAVGVTGLVASWIDWSHPVTAPLKVWIPAAIVGLLFAMGGTYMKARARHVGLWNGTVRKMIWGLAPALVAGTFLTLAVADVARPLIPGMWLVVYGAGVTAGGVFSVPALRFLGLCAIATGAVALFRPELGLLMLALGFGVAHALFGFYIAVRHGG